MNKKRIVFFTPTFNRTGSEIALFNLITNSVNELDMTVISKVNGELNSELPSGIKFISEEASFNFITQNSFVGRTLKQVLSRLKTGNTFLKKIHKAHPSEVWYINTITLPEVLTFAKENKIPAILHVHELEQMYNCISGEQLNNMISYPELIIACSNTCAEIIGMCGRKDKIEVCYPAIAFDNITATPMKAKEIRKKHGIDHETFLWLMSGTLDNNKNPSVFVEIASRLLKLNSTVKFMWICARNDDNGYIEFCKKKAITLGIDNKIIWVPKLHKEYYDYFNACNGFVLPSTRESFSMVAAEAIYLEKPVVSFDCGGIKEIINDQTGIIVPHYDIDSLIQAMIMITNKKFVFNVSSAREAVMQFDATKQQAKWKKIITNLLSESSFLKQV